MSKINLKIIDALKPEHFHKIENENEFEVMNLLFAQMKITS